MSAQPSGSNTASPPSLKVGLENLQLKRDETRKAHLGRLGFVAARFPRQVITPEDFHLLGPHLEDWSFATQAAKGREWVIGERPAERALVNALELELGTFCDGRRRRVGPRNGSIIMLIEEALLGDDIKTATDIEEIVSPATPTFVPAFEGPHEAAVIRYEAYLGSSMLQEDVRLLERWLLENPPGEPGQDA